MTKILAKDTCDTCIICNGIYGIKGNYTPKWKNRVCSECRADNHDGMNPNDLHVLLDAGVPRIEIRYNPKGNIIIPHFSEI